MATMAQINPAITRPTVPPTSYYEPQRPPVITSYYAPEAPPQESDFRRVQTQNIATVAEQPYPANRAYYYLRNSIGIRLFIFLRSLLLAFTVAAFVFTIITIIHQGRGFTHGWIFVPMGIATFGNLIILYTAGRLWYKGTQSLGTLLISCMSLDLIVSISFGVVVGPLSRRTNSEGYPNLWEAGTYLIMAIVYAAFFLIIDVGFVIWATKKRQTVMDSENAVLQATRRMGRRHPVPVYG